MGFATVRITPTLDTGTAYIDGDVLFLNTEFSLPAKKAKLVDAYIIDYEKKLGSTDAQVYFMSKNVANLGTLNATADISDANLRSNRVQGVLRHETQVNESPRLDNASIFRLHNVNVTGESSGNAFGFPISLVLHSEGPSDSNANPMYVSAIVNGSVSSITSADSLEIVLSLEY